MVDHPTIPYSSKGVYYCVCLLHFERERERGGGRERKRLSIMWSIKLQAHASSQRGMIALAGNSSSLHVVNCDNYPTETTLSRC